MESVVRVKKSLRTPIRKLTGCVSGVKERKLCAKRRNKRGRGGGGRRGCSAAGKTPPVRAANHRDPSIIRSYQADLEKERKLREAMNAQKNAERATMRAHFRRKYKLSENSKDTDRLKSAGGKVSLPRELSKMIHPKTNSKGNGFNLLSAFQGLSFDTTLLTGTKRSATPTPTPRQGNPCKIM